MRAYLLSIIGVTLISGILTVILPEGKTSSAVKGIAKLCCLLAIVAPVLDFFAKKSGAEKINFFDFSGETVIETDSAFIDYCSEKRIEYAEEELKNDLKKTFSLDVAVELVWTYEIKTAGNFLPYDGEEIHIEKVLLKTEFSPDKEVKKSMAEHIEKNYGCEVEFLE